MPITFSIDVSRVIRALDAAEVAVRGRAKRAMVKGYLDVGRIYAADQQRRFDRLSAGGSGWAPLAPSTVKKKGGRVPKLYETGKLRRSLDLGAPGNIFQVTERGVTYGTNNRVAKYHQFGTQRMPFRKVIDKPSRAAQAAMNRAMNQTVANILAAARTGPVQI